MKPAWHPGKLTRTCDDAGEPGLERRTRTIFGSPSNRSHTSATGPKGVGSTILLFIQPSRA